jgi:hypothetical protein
LLFTVVSRRRPAGEPQTCPDVFEHPKEQRRTKLCANALSVRSVELRDAGANRCRKILELRLNASSKAATCTGVRNPRLNLRSTLPLVVRQPAGGDGGQLTE